MVPGRSSAGDLRATLQTRKGAMTKAPFRDALSRKPERGAVPECAGWDSPEAVTGRLPGEARVGSFGLLED